jgi:hypothetical protein
MRTLLVAACLVVFSMLTPLISVAGPPFLTDDPEPVDFHHWEFYVASIQQYQREESDATLPHIEINYGVIPNVQIHLLVPMEYMNVGGGSGPHYGYSNTEFGIKYRFMSEGEAVPQVGVFPLVEVPTGNQSEGLSNGAAQVYLPVWLQKSWGKFTTYGGAGYWLDYGPGTKNWLFAGWEAQYDFSDAVTMGGELYYHTAQDPISISGSGFNIGGFFNLNDHHHILCSAGHSFTGEATTTAYIGYQYTI